MTVHLPKDMEASIEAAVRSGHFANRDDMVATAVREYLERHGALLTAERVADVDPLPGLMRDHAELMDQIVEDVTRNRES